MPPITVTPTVTDGLIDLMKNLTKNVLREKPDNIYEYAAKFCENLLLERDGSLDKGYEKFRILLNQKGSTVRSSIEETKADGNNPNFEKQTEVPPDNELNESESIETLNDSNTNEIESSKKIRALENQPEKLQNIEELNDDDDDDDDEHYDGDDDVFIDENAEHTLTEDSDGDGDENGDGNSSNDDTNVTKPKNKQRKLSSKKPAENLIVIKEESSTDDVDGEKIDTVENNTVEQSTPNNLHEIQTEAAIKIQKVFRKYILRQQIDTKSELIKTESESNQSKTALINEDNKDNKLSKDIAASIIQRAFKSFINKKMNSNKIESESIIHQHLSPNNNDEINESDSGIDDQPPITDNILEKNLKEFNKYIASAPAYLELTSTDTDDEEGVNKLARLSTPGDSESGISEKSFNLHIHEHADDGLLNQENRIDDNTSLSTIDFIQEEDEENYEENATKTNLLEPLNVINNKQESAVDDEISSTIDDNKQIYEIELSDGIDQNKDENLNNEINDSHKILDKEITENLDKNITGDDTIENLAESEELLLNKNIPDRLQSDQLSDDDQLKDTNKTDNEALENEINSNDNQNKKAVLHDETGRVEKATELEENVLEKKITETGHSILSDGELKSTFNEQIKDIDNPEDKINSIANETTSDSKEKTPNMMVDHIDEIQSQLNDDEFKPNLIENIENQIVKDFHENIISEDEENTESSIVTVIEGGDHIHNASELVDHHPDGIDVNKLQNVENVDIKDDENNKNNDVVDKEIDEMNSDSNKGSEITDIIKENIKDKVENVSNNIENIVDDRLESEIQKDISIKETLIEKENNDENLSIDNQLIKNETTMDMIEKIELKDDQAIIEEVTNDGIKKHDVLNLITQNEEKITTDKLIGDPNIMVESAEIQKDELINDELSPKNDQENMNVNNEDLLNNNDRDTDLNINSDKVVMLDTEKQEYVNEPDTDETNLNNDYHEPDEKIEYFEDVGLRYVGDLNLNVSTPAIHEESKNAKLLNIIDDDIQQKPGQEQSKIDENSLDKSAIKIQKVFRGYSVRKELERNKFTKSATLIQSIFRGFMVRKKLHIKDDKDEQSPIIPNNKNNSNDDVNKNNIDVIENIAATTIQKNYRGYSVRKELKSDKTAENFNITQSNNNANTQVMLTNTKHELEHIVSDVKNEDNPLNKVGDILNGLPGDELKQENTVETIQEPNKVLEENVQTTNVEKTSIDNLNDKNSKPLNEVLIIKSENNENKDIQEVDDKLNSIENLNDKIEIQPLQILEKIVENNDAGLSAALDDNIDGSENKELHHNVNIVKDDEVNQPETDKNDIKDKNEIKETPAVKILAYETTDDKDDNNNNNTAESLETSDALKKLDIDNSLAIEDETNENHQMSVSQNEVSDKNISVKDLEIIPGDELLVNSIITSLPLSDNVKDESENILNTEKSNDLIDTKEDVRDQPNDIVIENELNKIEITPLNKINLNASKVEEHLINSTDKNINEEVKHNQNEQDPNDVDIKMPNIEDKILTKSEDDKLSIDLNIDESSKIDNNKSNKDEAATLIQKNFRGYRLRRDIQNEKPTAVGKDSQQSVSSVPIEIPLSQQFSNDFTTELIESNDKTLNEKETSNQTLLDNTELEKENNNSLAVIPPDDKSQIWVLGEYVNDKNLIDAKKKSFLLINDEFKNNNIIPEEDGSFTPTPDDATKQFVMPSGDDTREKSATANAPDKIEQKSLIQSYSSTIDDSNDESSSIPTDQNRFTSSEDELKKFNGKYQSVSYEQFTGGSDTDSVNEMENKKPPTEHDGKAINDIQLSNDNNNTDSVNENSKIQNKDLIDIETFDITNYGEDSLEAMYYSLRKNEIMLDRMHQRAEEERKSASKDGRNIDNIERKSLQQRAMSDLGDIRHTLPQQSISYDSENTDNGDVILENLSLNSSTEKNTTPPPPIKTTKFDTSHQIEDNSHLDFCLESDSTDTEMDTKPKNKQWSTSMDEEQEEEEEEDTFPQYEDIHFGNVQRKVIASAISEADSDYYEPNAIQSLSITRLVKDDFNISTAIGHLPQTSTDSDSTIISAATKIQAGARGFLTRRRLRRSSGGGTTTPPSVERPPSFGNAAIDKSLDDLIEQQEQIYLDEAAIKIQRSYRQHLKEKMVLKPEAIKYQPLINEETMDYDGDDDSSPDTNNVDISKIKVEQKTSNENLNIFDDENDEKLLNEKKNNPSSISSNTIKHSIDDDDIVDDANNNNNQKISTEEVDSNDVPSNEKSHLSSMNYDDLDTAQRRMTLQRGDAVQRNSTPDSELDTSINNNNNNETLTTKNNVDVFVDKNKLKLDDKPQEVNDDDDDQNNNDKHSNTIIGDNLSNNSSEKNNSDDVEKSSLNDSMNKINNTNYNNNNNKNSIAYNKNTNYKTIINKRIAPSSASAAIDTQKISTQLFIANNANSNQEKSSSIVDKSTEGKQNKHRGKNELKFSLGIRQNSMPVQIDSEFMRVIPKHLRKRVKSAGSFRNKFI